MKKFSPEEIKVVTQWLRRSLGKGRDKVEKYSISGKELRDLTRNHLNGVCLRCWGADGSCAC